MFYTMRRIYKKTKDKTLLDKAVKRGWITTEQENEIIAEIGE